MGNPHPTRSKPCKLGRKHTGAPGLRQRGREASRAAKTRKEWLARFRAYKAEVAKWWRDERDTFPAKPTL